MRAGRGTRPSIHTAVHVCIDGGTHLHQEDLGVVLEEVLQALEVPCLAFRGERHLDIKNETRARPTEVVD